VKKPADQIIRLNIQKVLYLEIFHERRYSIATSYIISNGGEGIVTIENNTSIVLLATIASQLGKHTLKIILTDYYQRSSSETISVHVINDPPVFIFGPPKSQKIIMNKVSTYKMPTYFDLELLPVTVVHTKLPPFCTFSDDVYIFDPVAHFLHFEVSGFISDSLNQQTLFSFKVEVTNTRPYFKK
jgi:hypothetical protein